MAHKPIIVHGMDDLEELRVKIVTSCKLIRSSLQGALALTDDFALIHALRFEKIGFDPLDESCSWNLIEQLNQTTTYLVTLAGATELMMNYARPLRLNLGTLAGHDIESQDGEILAEAFAATSFSSNRKLALELNKLKHSPAPHRYIYYYALRPWNRDEDGGVKLRYFSATVLGAFVKKSNERRDLPPLPTFDIGEALVDVADREALYDAMGGDELQRFYGGPAKK